MQYVYCTSKKLKVSIASLYDTLKEAFLSHAMLCYSLEELMLKLKLQYFGHLMRRTDLEKALVLEKIEDGRRRGRQRMRWLVGITDGNGYEFELWELVTTGKPGVLQSMGSQRVGHDRATELN